MIKNKSDIISDSLGITLGAVVATSILSVVNVGLGGFIWLERRLIIRKELESKWNNLYH